MKIESIIVPVVAFSSSALATPVPGTGSGVDPPSNIPFVVQAVSSDSRIDHKFINAADNGFWINAPSKSSCNFRPSQPGSICPDSPATAFLLAPGNTVILDVAGLAGQDVGALYPATSVGGGDLLFNSANDNSPQTGVNYNTFSIVGGVLYFNNKDFYACKDSSKPGAYRVFGDFSQQMPASCLTFSAKVTHTVGFSAWQYD